MPGRTPPKPPYARKPNHTQLSQADVGSIVALARAGHTQTHIAKTLGVNVSTICRWLQQLGDTTDLARQRLRAGSSVLAERVIAEANVEEALEVLDRLDVAPKRAQESSKVGVQVVIGMPGQPVGIDPMKVNTTRIIGHEHTAQVLQVNDLAGAE